MSLLSIRMRAEPLRSLAFGAISAAYAQVGPALNNAPSQILVQNLTDSLLVFSFDGIVDHFVLPAGGFFLSDIASNKALGGGLCLSRGDGLWVKVISAPSVGSVYFSVFYGSDN